MSLLALPQELLLQIAQQSRSVQDIRALLLTCKYLTQTYNSFIYECDIKHGHGISLLFASAYNMPSLAMRAIEVGIEVNATISPETASAIRFPSFEDMANYPNCFIGWTALQLAAYSDSFDVVRILVDAGADLEGGNDTKGRLPLHLSICNSCITTSQLLLELGADILAHDAAGAQPLHYAAAHGGAECVQLLLDAGAAIEADSTGVLTQTPLYMAIQQRCHGGVQALLENGADLPNGLDGGYEALMFATACSSLEVVACVMEHGLRRNLLLNYVDCLEMACAKGWTGVIELVVEASGKQGIVRDMMKRHGKPLKYLDQYSLCSKLSTRAASHTMRGYGELFKLVGNTNKDVVAVVEILLHREQYAAARRFCQDLDLRAEKEGEGTPLMTALVEDKRDVAAFLREEQSRAHKRHIVANEAQRRSRN